MDRNILLFPSSPKHPISSKRRDSGVCSLKRDQLNKKVRRETRRVLQLYIMQEYGDKIIEREYNYD